VTTRCLKKLYVRVIKLISENDVGATTLNYLRYLMISENDILS